MNPTIRMTAIATTLLAPPLSTNAGAEEAWMGQVGQALGKTGTEMPGGVYRVGLPPTDLRVTLDEVALKPGFALGGWLVFEAMGKETTVMGDLVLTQDEVAPVMRKFEDEGGLHHRL